MSRFLLPVWVSLLLATGYGVADTAPESRRDASVEDQPATDSVGTNEGSESPAKKAAETPDGPKVISGMSILGNQEAPKSLVIVPWKSSVLGNSLGISTLLDDSRQPIDREVFMRALRYYEIRSATKP